MAKKSGFPDAISDLILLQALRNQTEEARNAEKLDRFELMSELFQHYMVLRTELNTKLDEVLSR
jgi:hypothetical protein